MYSDSAQSEAENRWFTLGQTSNGQLLAVSHTDQTVDADRASVRLISPRPATRREREQYQDEQAR
jgi:uncharacterized DUF497 family protein